MDRYMRISQWRLAKKMWQYYLLALPGLIYFLLFHYLPMFGLVIGFKDYSIYTGIFESNWVGLSVFYRLFRLDGFLRALRNTVIISLYKLCTGFPASILIALLLNELRTRLYSKYVQTALIIPHFVSWVVIYGLLYALLSPNIGLVGTIYGVFAPNTAVPNLLANKNAFRSLLVVTNVWRNAGFASIMYTAAIAGIDPQIYESAQLDGAGRFKQAIHVTLPCIRTTIITMWILRLGSILSVDFEQVLALQNPVVLETGDIIDTFVYRMGLKQAEYSLSTAAGLFKSVIAMMFVIGTNAIVRKIDSDSALM